MGGNFGRVVERNDSGPCAFDADTPHIARMYDYWLGGKDNFAVDRAAAERLVELVPETRDIALANRRFLVRAVRHLASRGIDQFIDLGAGVPTSPNVHEVARETHPDARVVYVDSDPIVAVHHRALNGADGVLARTADARDTEAVLGDERIRGLIDFTRPVGVLCVGVLHYLGTDAEVRPMLDRYAEACAPGSYRAASIAGSAWTVSDVTVRRSRSEFTKTSTQLTLRTCAEIAALMSDLDLDEPGLVPITQWQTSEPDLPVPVIAAVGRHHQP